MSNLLAIREKMKTIYSKFEVYITPVIKFLAAFVALMLINKNLGFMGKLGSTAIVLIIALMCSFLPLNFIILFSTAFVLAHMYKLSLEIAVFTLIVFLLLYLLYFRFSPRDTFVVVLTPVCFMLKIPYVIPLSMGLIGTPASIISVGCGVIVYYLIQFVHVNAAAIKLMDPDGSIVRFRYIVDGMLGNKAMLVTIIAFAATITVVYVIRRLSVDHAWTIAIISGSLMNVIVLLAGDLLYDTKISLPGTFVGALVSAAVGVVLMFFVFNVDYSRTEKVQFEDDDYYYYVKAVPKNTVAPKERSVKRINAQDRAGAAAGVAAVKGQPQRKSAATELDDEDVRIASPRTRTGEATRSQTMTRTPAGPSMGAARPANSGVRSDSQMVRPSGQTARPAGTTIGAANTGRPVAPGSVIPGSTDVNGGSRVLNGAGAGKPMDSISQSLNPASQQAKKNIE